MVASRKTYLGHVGRAQSASRTAALAEGEARWAIYCASHEHTARSAEHAVTLCVRWGKAARAAADAWGKTVPRSISQRTARLRAAVEWGTQASQANEEAAKWTTEAKRLAGLDLI